MWARSPGASPSLELLLGDLRMPGEEAHPVGAQGVWAADGRPAFLWHWALRGPREGAHCIRRGGG